MNDAPRAPFDWKAPDYGAIYAQRGAMLRRLRSNPAALPGLTAFYRDNPWQFISDWGETVDPRGVERGLPSRRPFVLWPKQVEMVQWMHARWLAQEPGIVEKSRDCGASWLSMAYIATLALFHPGSAFLTGSRKEDLVDNASDPNSLFFKLRQFLEALPREFTGHLDLSRHSADMRISLPNGSAVIGEAGTQIGRGSRASLVILDEAAFLERSQVIDAALSATSPCVISVSTPNGRANSFAEKRFSGRYPVFTFSWRDDPRKDQAWYAAQTATLDPVTVAAEIDLNYSASVEGILIPSAWIQSAIGAHTRLGIEPTGFRRAALDVADEGKDLNAFAGRHGIVLQHLRQWSGKGADIYATTIKAFDLCTEHGHQFLLYDADGLGAGVRGDARVVNEKRAADGRARIHAEPFRGSASPCNPDREMVPGRKNKDFFANAKAQAWWHLRLLFQNTHRAVTTGVIDDRDALISLDPGLPELQALVMELSQPTYSLNSVGKILVDKTPDGMKSPNLADAVMIVFNPSNITLQTWVRCAG